MIYNKHVVNNGWIFQYSRILTAAVRVQYSHQPVRSFYLMLRLADQFIGFIIGLAKSLQRGRSCAFIDPVQIG